MEQRGCDDLVYAAAGGCAAAFAALIDANYDRIHAMAWRWAGNGPDAEDIAQDVCIKLGKAIREFRGEAAFTTWLYRITYNAAIDHLRARQKTLATEPSQIVKLVDRPSDITPETKVMGAQLWDQVRALPPQQRDSVLLVYAQDLSHSEAAQILGCSEKTISWHLHEARKKLKATLEAAE